MKRRVLALVVPLILIAAACGSSGHPETFSEQPGSLSDDLQPFATELVGDLDADQVPLIQRNFLEGCMTGDGPRLDGLSGGELAAACGCSYDGLVTFLQDNETADQSAFDTFVALDDEFEKDEQAVSANYKAIFDGCRG